MSYEINRKLLDMRMVENGYNIKELSDHIGITRESLSKKLSGKQPLRLDECQMIKDALKLSNADVKQIFFTKTVD